jgi:hypothetical protein
MATIDDTIAHPTRRAAAIFLCGCVVAAAASASCGENPRYSGSASVESAEQKAETLSHRDRVTLLRPGRLRWHYGSASTRRTRTKAARGMAPKASTLVDPGGERSNLVVPAGAPHRAALRRPSRSTWLVEDVSKGTSIGIVSWKQTNREPRRVVVVGR